MKRAFPKILWGTGAAFIVAFGLFLVAWDILKTADWSFSHFLRDAVKTVSELFVPKRTDEVRNFVLFTKVRTGKQSVVTGTEYASTHSKTIIAQWCYLDRRDVGTGTHLRLTLAQKNKSGTLHIPSFHPGGLTKFNLTKVKARALVKSHCRFQ